MCPSSSVTVLFPANIGCSGDESGPGEPVGVPVRLEHTVTCLQVSTVTGLWFPRDLVSGRHAAVSLACANTNLVDDEWRVSCWGQCVGWTGAVPTQRGEAAGRSVGQRPPTVTVLFLIIRAEDGAPGLRERVWAGVSPRPDARGHRQGDVPSRLGFWLRESPQGPLAGWLPVVPRARLRGRCRSLQTPPIYRPLTGRSRGKAALSGRADGSSLYLCSRKH